MNTMHDVFPVRCACGNTQDTDVLLIVDPTENAPSGQAVRDGTFNLVRCPRCGKSSRAAYPVLLIQGTEIPPMVIGISAGMKPQDAESLIGLWASRAGPEALARLNTLAFRLHPLVVPHEDLPRFVDDQGNRPIPIAWKAAYRTLSDPLNDLPKEDFIELATRIIPLWASDNDHDELAFIKGRLGTAVDDTEKAITYLTEALAVLQPDTFPYWGAWKYELGCHYSVRTIGEKSENLEYALTCFEQALGHISREKNPVEWAMCSQNASILYGERIFGDRAENSERSLDYMRNIFETITPDNYPELCARSHIIAGAALKDRPSGSERELKNIAEAIEHYQSALTLFQTLNDEAEIARTHALLGQAYVIDASKRGSSSLSSRKAIEHIEEALNFTSRRTSPDRWAGYNLNMAAAYQLLPGNRKENLDIAKNYYEEALSIFTRDYFPVDWAGIQINLAKLSAFTAARDFVERPEEAIEYFNAALTVYTEENDPVKYAQIQEDLADIYYGRQLNDEALRAYQAILRVKAKQFGLAYTPAGRELELKSVAKISARVVQLLILSHREQEGLAEHERWRAKILKESLLWERNSCGSLESPEWKLLKDTSREIQSIEAQLHAQSGSSLDRRPLTDRLLAAKACYRDLADGLGPISDPTDILEDILSGVPADGAMIVPVPCKELFLFFFVIKHGETSVSHKNIAEAPQPVFSIGRGNQIEPLFGQQSAVTMEPREFSRLLAHLGSQKIDYVIDKLANCCLKVGSAIVVLGTPLEILGLHVATIWTHEGRAEFLDRHSIRYAPGSYILRLCEERLAHRDKVAGSLFAVIDTSKDLYFAALEVAAAQKYFDRAESLVGDNATLDAVRKAVPENSYLHFACHGFSSLEAPYRSSLSLAQGDQLTALEVIKNLDLSNCRLVVLSACQTGLTSSEVLQNEFLGLPIAFLQAGAPAVISTLWRVGDESTMLLMHQFYKLHRHSGIPASVALGKAQSWLRLATNADVANLFEDILAATCDEEGRGNWLARAALKRYQESDQNKRPFMDPYYWGAFTYMGAEVLSI